MGIERRGDFVVLGKIIPNSAHPNMPIKRMFNVEEKRKLREFLVNAFRKKDSKRFSRRKGTPTIEYLNEVFEKRGIVPPF